MIVHYNIKIVEMFRLSDQQNVWSLWQPKFPEVSETGKYNFSWRWLVLKQVNKDDSCFSKAIMIFIYKWLSLERILKKRWIYNIRTLPATISVKKTVMVIVKSGR